MSASSKKKAHQDAVVTGWVDPKTAQEAKQRKEAHRSNIMYATIAVVFVLVAITAIVWRTNIFQKRAVAATINGETYTAAEVNYYFQTNYQNFVNQNASYLSYFGLDTQKPLRDQPYGAEGETWFDFFADQTMEQMKSIQALSDAAKADGFTWTDEMQTQFDTSAESMKAYAKQAGYAVSQYLRAVYGPTISQGVYDAQMKRSILAQAYATSHEDSLTYTPADLTAAYTADSNTYDVADYESIRVSGAVAETDADGNAVEVTDAMKAEAMAAAKKTADELYASLKAGKDISTLASAEDTTVTYTKSDAAGYYDTVLGNWVFDKTRTAGNTALLPDEENNFYYVALFHDRYRQEYNTVNVRHILIQPATGTLKDGDEGYADEQATLKAEAKTKADDILAQWAAGEATEDSFAKLAMEHSADGNAAQGGLYSQVAKGSMVETFNDWIYNSARKTGDTGVVETDYGYHVMYFSGTDLPYWETQVTTALKTADFEEWYTAQSADYTAEQAAGMKHVG